MAAKDENLGQLEDQFENMSTPLVKDVASKANDTTGDGTTTATALLDAMIKEGLKKIPVGK